MELLEERTLLSVSWYVSSFGSDTLNDGQSLGTPFQTIQKAALLATAGDTVYIRAGTYHETVAPANSGTSGAPITFMPYNGEKVVIDGADPLSGWTLYNNGASGPIYQAPMNWSYNSGDGDQTFVDGQMMNYARWPNTSLDVSHPTKATAASASFTAGTPNTGVYTSAALSAFPASYWNGATIHFEPGAQNFQETGTVTSSAPGSVTFTYVSQGSAYDPSAGNSFYLDGKFQALDASGEWYLDPTAQQLYLWTPTGDSPSNHTVEAKTRTYGFELSGRSYINIQGVNIFACAIDTSSASTHDTINSIQALYVSNFEQATTNQFGGLHMQDTGIIIQGSNNILENSEIGYSAGNGVLLMGNNTSLSTGNVITNNVIHDVNYMALDCGGVNTGNGGGGDPTTYSATSTFNTISNNTIYNSGRDLIVFRNLGSGLIENNDLYGAMLQTVDGGGMYSYMQNGKASSSSPDTVIAYNRVHDIYAFVNGFAAGIYLDNGSTNYVVDHNLVYNSSCALELNEPSNSNEIHLNTLVGSQYSIASGADLPGTLIEDNLYVGPVNLGSNYGAGGSTDNIFPGAAPSGNYAYTAAGFVDPTALNFQLQSNSAAVNTGMVISPYTNGYVGSAPDIGAFEYGLTPWTAGASAVTNFYIGAVPAAPTALAATSPSSSEIDLTWQNNAASATSCVVERSTDDRTFTPIVRLPASVASYADTALPPGTYYYRVRADNGSYNSTYSNYASAALVPFANTIQAESFNQSYGVTANGAVITNCNVGNWAEYYNVNFPTGVNSAGAKTAVNLITVRYSSVAAGGNSIQFYADSLTGTLLGSVTTQYDSTGGFFTATINIGDLVPTDSIPAGLHNIYIAFAGTGNGGQNVANIDWFRFSSVAAPALQQTLAAYYTDTGPTGAGVFRSGTGIGGCDNGDWVQYANVYFSAGVNQVALNYTTPYGAGDYIQFRVDSISNPVVAQDTTQAYTSTAGTDTIGVSGVSAGWHDVYISFVQHGTGPYSGICNFNWFQFGGVSTAAAPTGLGATAASSTSVNLSWNDNSNNEAGFKIERSTDGQTFIQVGAVGPNSTATDSFTDTGLSGGTTYYYQVRAYNQDFGNTAYTNVANALTYAAAPTAISVTPVSTTQVNLSWMLVNPSFENPAIGTNSYLYYASMSTQQKSYFAWTAAGNSLSSYGPAVENASTAWGFTAAPAGPQACVLQADASISQIVAFSTPGVYSLGWSAEGRPGGAYHSNPIEVLLDGAPVGTYTPGTTAWSNYSSNLIVIAAGPHAITFLGTNPSQNYATAINNISVSVPVATVSGYNNPSFENPAIGTNSYLYYASMSTQQKSNFVWSASGNGSYGPVLENASAAWGFTSAPSGAQACVLQKDASISQTVNFSTVGAYPLAWSAEGRPNYPSDPIEVLLDGVAVATYTPSTTSWSSYATMLTVATAGIHTIAFLGTNSSQDCATAIDNISLPVGMVSGYNIYRGTTPGGENYAAPLNGGTLVTTTNYSDTTASPGTKYYYTVKAVNVSGSSMASNEVDPPTYPNAPTGLSATPGWTNQINLGWTAPGGIVSGYNVYRGTTPGSENYAAPLNGGTLVTSTHYYDTTVSPGTTYYYTVEAVNVSGSSVASNEANATTLTAAALPTTLKAYWRLDEGAGATANDTATGGTVADTGTLYGTPTWVAGKVGNALQLNGTSQYLRAANSADVNISGAALTVALWAKSGATNWNSTETFLSKGNGIKFGGVSGTKNLEVSLYISGAWRNFTYTNTADISTNWRHYAVTYDGTNVRFYVDGVNVSTQARTGSVATNTSVFYIGRLGSAYLNGSVDEVRVYNSVQSAANITALYSQAALAVTNLTVNSANASSYSVQSNLQVGANQYGDATDTNTFTTIPSQYLGSTFIRTANADGATTGLNLLSFTVNQPVTIYILYNTSYTTPPSWLTTDFTATDDHIVTTQGTFSVFQATVSAGTISLGGNSPDGLNNFGMYGVLVVPVL